MNLRDFAECHIARFWDFSGQVIRIFIASTLPPGGLAVPPEKNDHYPEVVTL